MLLGQTDEWGTDETAGDYSLDEISPADFVRSIDEQVVANGKATARKPSASTGSEGYLGSTGTSLWPWLLGAAVLTGGAYWFIKRRKRRSKKGK